MLDFMNFSLTNGAFKLELTIMLTLHTQQVTN